MLLVLGACDEARRERCASEPDEANLDGTWVIEGEGERDGCNEGIYNGDFTFAVKDPLQVRQTPASQIDELSMAEPVEVSGGSFSLTGTVDGSCVDFTTTEIQEALTLAFSFIGDVDGTLIEGDFTGTGPEGCESEGEFAVTVTLFDDCAAAPCENGGSCIDGPNLFVCNCPLGWTGPTCANVDDCDPNPCQNGSTCIDGDSSFTCDCASGWRGPTCTEDDPCVPDPCQNGTCVYTGVGTWDCQCPAGLTGESCELDVDECGEDLTDTEVDESLGPCGEEADSCTNTFGSYECSCGGGETTQGAPCEAGCGCGSARPEAALVWLALALVLRRALLLRV
jgi:hypothetical protein